MMKMYDVNESEHIDEKGYYYFQDFMEIFHSWITLKMIGK